VIGAAMLALLLPGSAAWAATRQALGVPATDPMSDPWATIVSLAPGSSAAADDPTSTVAAGASPQPANTPQPTGQPLPSKRQRLADSVVAAFVLVVLAGGIIVSVLANRRSRAQITPTPARAPGSGALVEPEAASQ